MRTNLTSLLLLVTAAWLLGGCSSDSTSPNDNLPPLEKADVAAQSGFLAVAMVDIAPIGATFSGKAEGEYVYTFMPPDPVQGTVNLLFHDGGPDGTPSTPAQADWVRATTPADAPLSVALVEDGLPWLLAFNLVSDIDRASDTATVGGAGTLVVGNYTAAWTLDGLVVFSDDSGAWPAEGTLTFTNEGITAVVTFDGDHTATVTVDGDVYMLDLNDGDLTPAG
jgi:hypothetical protein